MKLEDCPVEILSRINSYLDFSVVALILPSIGCELLSRKLLQPNARHELALRSPGWLKCPDFRWASSMFSYSPLYRLVIHLPTLSLPGDTSWVLRLPKSMLHLDFQFDNAEQIWWQISEPKSDDKWRTLSFSSHVLGSYGLYPIAIRDIFPSLQYLRLVSSGTLDSASKELLDNVTLFSPLDQFMRPSNPVNPISGASLKWVMGLPPSLTSLEASTLLFEASRALRFGGMRVSEENYNNWCRWQTQGFLDANDANVDQTEPFFESDRKWSLPLPVSLLHLPSQDPWITKTKLISNSIASKLQTLHLPWNAVNELSFFPQLRHLVLGGLVRNIHISEVSLHVLPHLETLKLVTIPHTKGVSDFFSKLPPSLRVLFVSASNQVKLADIVNALPNLIELHLLHTDMTLWTDSAPTSFPSALTSLTCAFKASSFDTRILPRTLTDLSFISSTFMAWKSEYSLGLPHSLISLSCDMLPVSKDPFLGFVDLPPSVTKLTLVAALELSLDDMAALFPKTLREMHLPQFSGLSDIDVARLPRYWVAMSVSKLFITGRTIPNDMVGTLTLDKICASIEALLPPKMAPFWQIRPDQSTPGKSSLCSLVPHLNIQLPPGISELDLCGDFRLFKALHTAFSALSDGTNLRTFRSDTYCVSDEFKKHKTILPKSLTCFYTLDGTSPPSPAHEPLPEALISLQLPKRAIKCLPDLPALEFLEVSDIHDSSILSRLTRLKTLKVNHLTSAEHVGTVPESLTSLEIPSNFGGGEISLPSRLTLLSLPRISFSLTNSLAFPETLTHMNIKDITTDSTELLPVLPLPSRPSVSTAFTSPNDVSEAQGPAKLLQRHIEASKILEIQNRHRAHWFALTSLSASDVLPIVESVLKARFSHLQVIQTKLQIDWEMAHVSYLPPLLNSCFIHIKNQKTISEMQLAHKAPGSGHLSYFSFYSPLLGRMALNRAMNAEEAANKLLKPCFASFPATLTLLVLDSFRMPHWAPTHLPKTLSVLVCDSSLFNDDSYRKLPASLTALDVKVQHAEFRRSHARALPVGLKALHIRCNMFFDAVVGHLPRGLEVLDCESAYKLTFQCLSLLPPNLKALTLPTRISSDNRFSIALLPRSILCVSDAGFRFLSDYLSNF